MTSTGLGGLVKNLQPGESVLDAVKNTLESALYLHHTSAFKQEAWTLFSLNLLILFLSVLGIVCRFTRGHGWLFVRDDSGLVRPNAALVVQALFALYSICFMITVPTFSLSPCPTNAAFVFFLLSYVPLGFAFHTMTWSTALAPTTSLVLLTPRTTQVVHSRWRRRAATYTAIFIGILFPTSLIPPVYYTVRVRMQALPAVYALLEKIEEVKNAGGSDNDALFALVPLYPPVLTLFNRLTKLSRSLVIVFFAWAVTWMLVYFPTAIRLLSTLRQRRQRLLRSLRSLRTLEELVTNEEHEAKVLAASQLPPISAPSSPTLPRRPAPASMMPNNLEAYYELPEQVRLARTDLAALADPSSPQSASSSKLSHSPPSTTQLSPSLTHSDVEEIKSPDSTTGSGSSLSRFVPVLKRTPSSDSTNIRGESNEVVTSTHLEVPRVRKKKSKRPGTAESATKRARYFAEKLMDEFGIGGAEAGGARSRRIEFDSGEKIPETDKTASRREEICAALEKTNRFFLTLSIQACLTLVMVVSYLVFCIAVISGFIPSERMQTVFFCWTGWTFAGPALFGSFIFAIISFSSPPATPDQSRAEPVFDPDFSPTAAPPPPDPHRPPSIARMLSQSTSRPFSHTTRTSGDSGSGSHNGRTRVDSTATGMLLDSTSDSESEGTGLGFALPAQGGSTQRWVPSTWASNHGASV
ncbi:hypothetical protein T439DRAFT_375960 [Meredithblackwellia eburnea MCA 4105]